ncbi:MAG: NADH-quinone oxidoreductase subunit NuoF [Calditrichia bacterium]
MLNVDNLQIIKEKYEEQIKNIQRRIIICAGTGCVSNGSLELYEELTAKIKDRNLSVVTDLKEENSNPADTYISGSGCQGFCQMGPLMMIEPDGILYVRVRKEDLDTIIEKTILNNEVVEELLYKHPVMGTPCKGNSDIDFYSRQHRYTLAKCGIINPDDIHEYIHNDGYKAAIKCLTGLKPEDICEEILASGLRGRGGGGFPTGKKWQLTLMQSAPQKYVICNGDEGDPGAFMDRSIMEGNPHSVIEGMMIAGRAIGATKGYVYVRAEYPLAVARMRKAVEDARKVGVLGENILNTGFTFDIEVMEGAGAFVCGEETALIASIEGKRGMPMPKPPFPAERGLFGMPTVINNVETLSTIPLIINSGASEFRKIGTKTSPGTKTFALTGHVANTGLIEVPFGTTLREIIFDIGGGVTTDDGQIFPDGFKAVQIGGPSGGCLTEEHLDIPLDFDSLTRLGAMVGSGGLVVMNKHTCMVQVAKFFMQFTVNESCGKCVPCREGTGQMLELLNEIIEGNANEETLHLLDQLGNTIKKASLCGLGKTAPNPVLSTLNLFREEIEMHVLHKRCPANKCKALLQPEILPDLCKGCMICARKCPVGAITGEKRQPHYLDSEKCIKCGECAKVCKFNAVIGV